LGSEAERIEVVQAPETKTRLQATGISTLSKMCLVLESFFFKTTFLLGLSKEREWMRNDVE
jgi:hypothetical protein